MTQNEFNTYFRNFLEEAHQVSAQTFAVYVAQGVNVVDAVRKTTEDLALVVMEDGNYTPAEKARINFDMGVFASLFVACPA